MKNLALGWGLVVGLVLASSGNARAEEKPKPPLGATRVDGPAGSLTQTLLPGQALAWTPMPGGGVAVLIRREEDPDGERALYQVRGTQSQLLGLLPKAIDSLATPRVAGSQELWLGEPGRVSRWGPSGLSTVVEKKGLLLDTLRFGPTELTQVGVKQLAVYRPNAAGPWLLERQVDLPVSARRTPTGLEIKTYPVHELQIPGKPTLYAVGPEAVGTQRLRTLLIDPSAPKENQRQEIWSLLPRPEQVEHARYVVLDGRPYLAVLAVGSAELDLFEKWTLRIFPLREDRTRHGAGQIFAYTMETLRWFEPELLWRDLDGDGRTDLLLIEPQGISGNDLWLTFLPGKGGARFADRDAVRRKLDAPEGKWQWGEDLNRDGLADLVLSTGNRLELYLGQSGKKILAKEPVWSFEAPALDHAVKEPRGRRQGSDPNSVGSSAAPRVVELDDDPQPEILLVREAAGRAVVRVIDLWPCPSTCDK